MYKIIESVGSGKTQKLIKYAKMVGAAVVCSNPRAMQQKAHAYGISGVRFYSYEDLAYEPELLDDTPYVIDDLDKYVKFIIPNRDKFIGFTMNKE